MKFKKCYDGTFGNDVKMSEQRWVTLKSLGLSMEADLSDAYGSDFRFDGDKKEGITQSEVV